jgi:hypothetical protein
VVLTICFCSKSTNPSTKEPDFVLQVSPQTKWVTAGDSAKFHIKLTSLNGFSAPCTLSLVGLPQEDTAVFTQNVLVPPDSCGLIIHTTFPAPLDTYQLTITGKNKNLTHSAQAVLIVPPEKVTDYYPLAIGNSWTYVFLDQNGRNWGTISYSIIGTATINGNFCYLTPDVVFFYVNGDTIFSSSPGRLKGTIVLLGPLVIGQSWTADSWNYELVEFGPVTLTKGTEYKNCIKLKKMDPAHPEDETFEWWAKEVGKVKMAEYISGQYNGSLELESFTHP